jgi:PST family polysaccharide transporter/lipopolysaccharide exporter
MPDSRLARSFLNLAAGEAMARLIAFAAMLIVARRLGPAAYGVIGVASGIMLYLIQIADWGIELSGVPAVARQPDGITALASSALTFRLLVAVALTVVVVAIGVTVFPQPDGSILAIYSLGLVFVALGTRWIFLGLQQASRVAAARIGGELVALVVILVLLRGVGDIAIVPIASVIGIAFTTGVMLAGLRGRGIDPRLTRDRSVSRPLLARGPHLIGFTLLGLVLFNADLIYLRFISGEAAAGYYAAAYTFIAFAANLSVTWAHSVMPTMARFEKTDDQRNGVYQTALLLAYAVSLPVAVGGMLTASSVVVLVFGSDYTPAVPALVCLLAAVPIGAVREIAVAGLIGSPGGERRLIRVNAMCVAFNLTILIPVVPLYGLVGASIVTVLTEVLRLFLAFRFAREDGYRPPGMARFLKPALAAAAMVPVLLLAGDRPLLLLVAAGAAVYAAILWATGVLRLQKPFQLRVVV